MKKRLLKKRVKKAWEEVSAIERRGRIAWAPLGPDPAGERLMAARDAARHALLRRNVKERR